MTIAPELRSATLRGPSLTRENGSLSNRDQQYYASLLQRETLPSPEEVSSWMSSGVDPTAIRAAFLESAEFTINGGHGSKR